MNDFFPAYFYWSLDPDPGSKNLAFKTPQMIYPRAKSKNYILLNNQLTPTCRVKYQVFDKKGERSGLRLQHKL